MNHLPELVLVCGIAVILPVAGLIVAYLFRRLSSQERLRAMEKGVNIPLEPASPGQRAARVRRGGIVLLALGLGLAFSLIVGWLVEQEKEMLMGAAFGLITALIGGGLLIDYRLLRKEMAGEK